MWWHIVVVIVSLGAFALLMAFIIAYANGMSR